MGRLVLGLLLAVAVAVAACGDDDGAGAPDAGITLDAEVATDADTSMDASSDPGTDAAVELDADVTPPTDAGPPGDGGAGDLDHDGLDDMEEARLAREYLPFLSVDPTDSCPLAGIVYRARPHPDTPARVHFIVDVLFESDCGSLGHVGDNEVFGMTIDPTRAAPDGILAIRAISHQGTACQHISDCGSCAGLEACTTGMRDGVPFPVVFYSKNKHGSYMTERSCDGACFFTNNCVLAPMSAMPLMVNAGEPTSPLTNNLTTSGLITAANGWVEMELFDHDPWGATDFGGAGNVGEDMIDDAFLTPACP